MSKPKKDPRLKVRSQFTETHTLAGESHLIIHDPVPNEDLLKAASKVVDQRYCESCTLYFESSALFHNHNVLVHYTPDHRFGLRYYETDNKPGNEPDAEDPRAV